MATFDDVKQSKKDAAKKRRADREKSKEVAFIGFVSVPVPPNIQKGGVEEISSILEDLYFYLDDLSQKYKFSLTYNDSTNSFMCTVYSNKATNLDAGLGFTSYGGQSSLALGVAIGKLLWVIEEHGDLLTLDDYLVEQKAANKDTFS